MLVEAEKVDEGGSSVLRRHVHDAVKGRRRSPARTEAIWLTDLKTVTLSGLSRFRLLHLLLTVDHAMAENHLTHSIAP